MNRRGYARILESVLAGILMVGFLTYASEELIIERSDLGELKGLGDDTLIVLDTLPQDGDSFMYHALSSDPTLLYEKIAECVPDNVGYALAINGEKQGRETEEETVICRYVKIIDDETFIYKLSLYLWYK